MKENQVITSLYQSLSFLYPVFIPYIVFGCKAGKQTPIIDVSRSFEKAI
jgi:hypothetical protein